MKVVWFDLYVSSVEGSTEKIPELFKTYDFQSRIYFITINKLDFLSELVKFKIATS